MDKTPSHSESDWLTPGLIHWLFSSGRLIEKNNRFTQELATQLVAAGAPVDGIRLMVRTLNPQVLAFSNFWSSGTNRTETATARHGIRSTERYLGSPLEYILEQRKSLHQPLNDLPEEPHAAYAELLADGYSDYLGLPVEFSDGALSAIFFTTKKPGGFCPADIEAFHRLRDYLAPILELQSTRHTAVSVMNTYVGKRTGQKIMNGMVQRGDADIINAAIWFSDLRDFTHLTETLPAAQLLELLNSYFEFVSAAVTARGGEILRFIGDAMLIVFPIDENMCNKTACTAAIDAAIDAFSTLATLNHQRRRRGMPSIEFGVGLNIGEVIYGNVGASDRLDFTVMGPAVNRTARLESLTKTLDSSVLFSQEFAQAIEQPVKHLGDHAMKGIDGQHPVYALQDES